jgi:hypothetical protein
MSTEDADDDARWENRTGLTFAIDNHIIDGSTQAEAELRRLHGDGWIELVLTDVTRTEWLAANPADRQRLEALRSTTSSIGDRPRLTTLVLEQPRSACRRIRNALTACLPRCSLAAT